MEGVVRTYLDFISPPGTVILKRKSLWPGEGTHSPLFSLSFIRVPHLDVGSNREKTGRANMGTLIK